MLHILNQISFESEISFKKGKAANVKEKCKSHLHIYTNTLAFGKQQSDTWKNIFRLIQTIKRTIFFFLLLLLLFFYFTILYLFFHTSTCIHHGCTRVPHPEPPSHLPPHTIPLGHPNGIKTCIISYRKWIANPGLMQDKRTILRESV